MIQTGLKIDTIGKFLKDYLSILIIVPALIGGLWQSIELMSISIPYIRFFSISQIVPDGILILMFLVIPFSYYAIGWFADIFFFEKRKPKAIEKLDVEQYEKYRNREITISGIAFVVIYCCMIINFLYLKNNMFDIDDFKIKIITSYIMVFVLNYNLDNCYYFVKEKYKKYFKFCNSFLLLLYVIIAISFSRRIHNIFIAPSNIINIEQVKLDVAHKYPDTKQELLYFNDKYIFIKIIEKFKMDKKGKIIKHTSEKIYIMKLESLFIDK